MLKLFLPNNLALWAKLSAWNFSWAFGSVVQWQNNGAALFYRLSQSWGPSGPHTQHSGEASGRGTSAALAPLAVKWMFLDESKHTLSCVCGSQVAEELPLAGGPRGTRTEAPVKSHTYKRSRHTAREQLTHFLLTGLNPCHNSPVTFNTSESTNHQHLQSLSFRNTDCNCGIVTEMSGICIKMYYIINVEM